MRYYSFFIIIVFIITFFNLIFNGVQTNNKSVSDNINIFCVIVAILRKIIC